MNTFKRALRTVVQTPPLRRAVYPVADRVLKRHCAWRLRRYDISKTIVLVATGRGGSTWLSELVMSLPGRLLLWEPLHLGNNPTVRDLGVRWNTYHPVDTEVPELEKYLRRLLTGGEVTTRTLTSHNLQVGALLQPQGLVVKFVQVHTLLPWLVKRFPIPIVGMMRHPCAVIASQLQYGAGWKRLTKDKLDVEHALLDDYPHIARAFESITTTAQALAFAWGIKTYMLLHTRERLLVAYESLLEDPEDEAARIFSYLDHAPPADILRRVRRPSSTSRSGVDYDGWRDRLATWREQLSVQEQDQVLQMAHDLGVSCYGEDPWPDLSRVPVGD